MNVGEKRTQQSNYKTGSMWCLLFDDWKHFNTKFQTTRMYEQAIGILLVRLSYLCFFFLRPSWGFWLLSLPHSGTTGCHDKGFCLYIGHGGRVNYGIKCEKQIIQICLRFCTSIKKKEHWFIVLLVVYNYIFTLKKLKVYLPHRTLQSQPRQYKRSTQTARQLVHKQIQLPEDSMKEKTKNVNGHH